MSKIVVFIILVFLSAGICRENRSKEERMLTVFWNLENLFCPEKDTTYEDVEYLPDAPKHWTWGRYGRKVNGIVSTLVSLRDCTGIFPDVVGLAEVENEKVMKSLIFSAPFSRLEYSFVHFESPDRRGIDVGLLYRRKRLKVMETEPIAVPLEGGKPTRDILYVKAVFLPTEDTLHFFVNHWPSKYGGAEVSARNRNAASAVLLNKVDSVLCASAEQPVIVMGDFNDTKASAPVAALEASLVIPESGICSPLNLKDGELGTNKFRNRWDQIDLMMYGGKAVPEGNRTYIYAPEFLLVPDRKFSGYRVYRTYQGPHYAGGISDHLPVFCSFIFSSLKPKASFSRESPIGSM